MTRKEAGKGGKMLEREGGTCRCVCIFIFVCVHAVCVGGDTGEVKENKSNALILN